MGQRRLVVSLSSAAASGAGHDGLAGSRGVHRSGLHLSCETHFSQVTVPVILSENGPFTLLSVL